MKGMSALPAVKCECHVEPDATRVACPVREKLNGLKACWLNPVLLSHNHRPWSVEPGRPRKTPSNRSRDRRSGWVRGCFPSGIPLTGSGPKRDALSGYAGRKTCCPSSGLVQRERTGELSCGDARHRADDNARRSGERSLTVKSSTGNRPSRAFLAVRQETVPNREWTG